MHYSRIERIAKGLQSINAHALVCTLPSQVLMLTGYWPIVGTAIAIVTREGRTCLIAPEDEAILASKAATEMVLAALGTIDRPTTLPEDVTPYLTAAFHDLQIGEGATVAIDPGPNSEQASYVAFTIYGCSTESIVEAALPNCRLVDAHELLWNAAAVLDPPEIEVLRRAAFVAREAYERGASSIKAGVTEIEASLTIEKLFTTCALTNDGSDRAFGHVACMSGVRSGSAYGAFARSTRNTMAVHDLVLTHCNSTLSGYWTDVTRTYFLGDPPQRVRKMYDSLLKASRAGIAAVKPGVHASEVDTAVRESLTEDGYGGQFKHGTGHGVGFAAIDHRAKPRLRPDSLDILEPGMVFNIEPGIYFPDFGGMRHCDMVLCTEGGAELLTPFQQTLEELQL